MSDEDRDIDIESDAEKRAHHNALERKRRDHIKDSFCSLRDSVPALQGEKVTRNTVRATNSVAMTPEERKHSSNMVKASRAQILKKAADYIEFMRKKHNAHQQDIDDLKKQNNLLESQIRALEKTKYTGNFAAMSTASSHSPAKSDSSTVHSAKFDGSASDTSDSENSSHPKRMKT